jgi:hypothetical protein
VFSEVLHPFGRVTKVRMSQYNRIQMANFIPGRQHRLRGHCEHAAGDEEEEASRGRRPRQCHHGHGREHHHHCNLATASSLLFHFCKSQQIPTGHDALLRRSKSCTAAAAALRGSLSAFRDHSLSFHFLLWTFQECNHSGWWWCGRSVGRSAGALESCGERAPS